MTTQAEEREKFINREADRGTDPKEAADKADTLARAGHFENRATTRRDLELDVEVPDPFKDLQVDRYLKNLSASRDRILRADAGDMGSMEQLRQDHALGEVGIEPEEFNQRARDAGIDLDWFEEQVGRKNRLPNEVIEEAKERGDFAFQDAETRKTMNRRREIDRLAVEKKTLLRSPEDLMTEMQFTMSGEKSAFGGTVADDLREDPDAAQLGEAGRDMANVLLADIVSKADKNGVNLTQLVRRYGTQLNGYESYIDERQDTLTKIFQREQEDKAEKQPINELEVKARDQALKEIALFKTVGLWTGTAFVPPDYLVGKTGVDIKGKGFGLSLMSAMAPTLEIVGLNNNGQVVVRQPGLLQTTFDIIDAPQSFATGVLMSPDAWTDWDEFQTAGLEGIAQRRNFMEAAIETWDPQTTTGYLAAMMGGLFPAIFFPDLLWAGAKAYKLTDGVHRGIRSRHMAKQAIAEIDRFAEAIAAGRVEDAVASQKRLHENHRPVSDEIRRIIPDIADSMASEAPEIVRSAEGAALTKRLPAELKTPKAPDRPAPTGLQLNPSYRRVEYRPTDPTRAGQLSGIEAYDYNDHLKKVAAVRQRVLDKDDDILKHLTDAPMRKRTKSQVNLIRKALLSAGVSKANADKFIGEIGASLTQAVKDPEAWHQSMKGRLIGVEGITADTNTKAMLTQLTGIKKAAAKVGQEFGAGESLLDDLAKVERAIRVNTEVHAVAAVLVRRHIGQHYGIKLGPIIPRLMEKAYDVANLSELGLELSRKIEKSFKNVTRKEAAMIAQIVDARARAWARETGQHPEDYYATRIAGIKGKGEFMRRFFMNPDDPKSLIKHVLPEGHRLEKGEDGKYAVLDDTDSIVGKAFRDPMDAAASAIQKMIDDGVIERSVLDDTPIRVGNLLLGMDRNVAEMAIHRQPLEYAACYAEDGNIMRLTSNAPNYVGVTPVQMGRLARAEHVVFTHNHPSGVVSDMTSMLSDSDVLFAAKVGAFQMRATGGGGTWILEVEDWGALSRGWQWQHGADSRAWTKRGIVTAIDDFEDDVRDAASRVLDEVSLEARSAKRWTQKQTIETLNRRWSEELGRVLDRHGVRFRLRLEPRDPRVGVGQELVGEAVEAARGTSRVEGRDLLLQRATGKDPIYYSRVEQVAEAMPGKMGISDLLRRDEKTGKLVGWLAKQVKVKQDELVWTNIEQFLDDAKAAGKKSVTRDELLTHLRDNRVEVDTTLMGAMPPEVATAVEATNEAHRALVPAIEKWSEGLQKLGIPMDGTEVHRIRANPDYIHQGEFQPLVHLNSVLDPVLGQRLPNDIDQILRRSRLQELATALSKDRVTQELLDEIPRVLREVREKAAGRGRHGAVPVMDDIGRLIDRLEAMNVVPGYFRLTSQLENTPEFQAFASAKRSSDTLERTHVVAPMYEDVTLPGGTNYRETLITLKSENAHILADPDVIELRRLHQRGFNELGPIAIEDVEALWDKVYARYNVPADVGLSDWFEGLRRTLYSHGHWPNTPNVLVHYRAKDRVDDAGRKILFIEEIQSDWHQQGRELGYALRSAEVERIKAAAQEISGSVASKLAELESFKPPPLPKPDPKRGLWFDFYDRPTHGLLGTEKVHKALLNTLMTARRGSVSLGLKLGPMEAQRLIALLRDDPSWFERVYLRVGGRQDLDQVIEMLNQHPVAKAYDAVAKAAADATELLPSGWGIRYNDGKFHAWQTARGPVVRDIRGPKFALLSEAVDETLRLATHSSVPEAPFKDTKVWAALAIKHIMRTAADEGYAGVAFTSGDAVRSIPGIGLTEKAAKGFYDVIVPSVLKKEAGRVEKRVVQLGDHGFDEIPARGRPPQWSIDRMIENGQAAEFNLVELTPQVAERVGAPRLLFQRSDEAKRAAREAVTATVKEMEESGEALISAALLSATQLPKEVKVDLLAKRLRQHEGQKRLPPHLRVVKPDELKDIGLEAWIEDLKAAGRKTVTREEVVEFVRDNRVKVIDDIRERAPEELRVAEARLNDFYHGTESLREPSLADRVDALNLTSSSQHVAESDPRKLPTAAYEDASYLFNVLDDRLGILSEQYHLVEVLSDVPTDAEELARGVAAVGRDIYMEFGSPTGNPFTADQYTRVIAKTIATVAKKLWGTQDIGGARHAGVLDARLEKVHSGATYVGFAEYQVRQRELDMLVEKAAINPSLRDQAPFDAPHRRVDIYQELLTVLEFSDIMGTEVADALLDMAGTALTEALFEGIAKALQSTARYKDIVAKPTFVPWGKLSERWHHLDAAMDTMAYGRVVGPMLEATDARRMVVELLQEVSDGMRKTVSGERIRGTTRAERASFSDRFDAVQRDVVRDRYRGGYGEASTFAHLHGIEALESPGLADVKKRAMSLFDALDIFKSPRFQIYLEQHEEFRALREATPVTGWSTYYMRGAEDTQTEILLKMPPESRLAPLPPGLSAKPTAEVFPADGPPNDFLAAMIERIPKDAGIPLRGGIISHRNMARRGEGFVIDMNLAQDRREAWTDLTGLRVLPSRFVWGPTREAAIKNARLALTPNFKGSWFNTDNVFVHVRATTRMDDRGRKLLFIEEVQSDWNQEPKKIAKALGIPSGYAKMPVVSPKNRTELEGLLESLRPLTEKPIDQDRYRELYGQKALDESLLMGGDWDRGVQRKLIAQYEATISRISEILKDEGFAIRVKGEWRTETDAAATRVPHRSRPSQVYFTPQLFVARAGELTASHYMSRWDSTAEFLEQIALGHNRLEVSTRHGTQTPSQYPPTPLSGNWNRVVIKRILKYAADKKDATGKPVFDGVALTRSDIISPIVAARQHRVGDRAYWDRQLELYEAGERTAAPRESIEVYKGNKQFYDEALLNTMNKWTRQWGVKAHRGAIKTRGIDDFGDHRTELVEVPIVDFTPEMRAAVKESPLYQRAGEVEKLGPAGMSRAEFEATATELLHGTTRQFEQFDPAAAVSRHGRKLRVNQFYFTDQPEVAATFANAVGYRQVSLSRWADEAGELYDDPEMLAELQGSINKAVEKGRRKLAYVDVESGNLVAVNKAEDIPKEAYLEDWDIRLYKPDRWPRVVKTNVYGKTLDLTSKAAAPEDARHLIPEGGTYAWTKHEFDPRIVKYAAANGYGKIAVSDAYESGFKSFITVPDYIGYGTDPHRAFVKQALKDGKRPPGSVMVDYPDLALAHGYKPAELAPAGTMTAGERLYQTKEADDVLMAKAATEFLDDGRAWIYALENGDVSSLVHELGHIFRRDLSPDDMDVVTTWLKTTHALDITHEAGRFRGSADAVEKSEELFARAFEAYIASGRAPAPSLTSVFEKLKDAMVRIYRAIRGSEIDVNMTDEMRAIFDKLLMDSPPDSAPLPHVLDKIAKSVGGELIQTETPFSYIAREAQRLGIKGVTVDRLMDNYEAQPPGQRVIQLPKKMLHDWRKGGVDELTEKDLVALQWKLDNDRMQAAAEAKPSIPMKRRTQAISLQETKPSERIMSWASESSSGIGTMTRMGAKAIFGGDAMDTLRLFPPLLRQSIMAGVRPVKQAYAEAVALVADRDWDRIYSYLGGELVDFAGGGGREVTTSGWNAVGRLMDSVREELLAKDTVKEGMEELRWLSTWADRKLNKSVLGAAMDEKGPSGLTRLNTNPQVIDEVLYPGGSDFFKNLIKAVGAPSKRAEGIAHTQKSYRLAETLLFHSGITQRGGKAFEGTGTDMAKSLLEDIELIYDKDKAARVAVLLAGHGHAIRGRRVWTSLGVSVEEETAKAYARWMEGEALDPKQRRAVQALSRTHGMNVNVFTEAPVLGTKYYVPLAARERMSEALAMGILRGKEGILASEQTASGIAAGIVRYMKLRMTRGFFVVRQRYFMMNTIDHFTQFGMRAGFGPAAVSSSRMIWQNLMAFPGFIHFQKAFQKEGAIVKGGVFSPKAQENMRRALQSGGDTLARWLGRFMSDAKYHISVNKVLEGTEGTVNLNGRIYTYQDLRNIAIEEGIFASFDTAALGKAIKRVKKSVETEGGKQVKAGRFHPQLIEGQWVEAEDITMLQHTADRVGDLLASWTDDLVGEMSEAWAERERLGAMITLVERGYDPRTAARVTIDALYDYAGSMSKTDRSWLVSLFLPFWAYQKNANRQILDMMLSPEGAWRMGILRRAQVHGTDMISEIIYQSVVGDPYGIDTDEMPPSVLANYWGLRNGIENGYGPIAQIDPSTRRYFELQFGKKLEDLDKEDRDFIENGYGGIENVPRGVRQAMSILFSSVGPVIIEGRTIELNDVITKARADLDPLMTQGFAIPKPDKSGRATYHRDRAGVRIPWDLKEGTRIYYDILAENKLDHPHTELFLPDSTIHAGMRYITNAVAFYIMTFGSLPVGAAKVAGQQAGVLDEDEDAVAFQFAKGPSTLTTLRNVVDAERAPIPGVVMSTYEVGSAWPRRVHPGLVELVEMGFFTNLARVPASEDPLSRGEQLKDDEELRKLGKLTGERWYLHGPVRSVFFENSPLGELNRMLLGWEKTPLEETAMQGEMLRWARGITGVETKEVWRNIQAEREEPRRTIPTKRPPR